MKELNIKATIIALAAAFAGIGIWLSMLASEAVATITRDSVVMFTPPAPLLIVATGLMLGGGAMIAIQIATIYEKLHKAKPKEQHTPFGGKGFGSH